MSDTTEGTSGQEPQPQLPLPAPGSTPPADAAPEQTPEQAREKEENRRIAQLRARLGAAERESQRQAAELEFYRRQVQPPAGAPETPELAQARMRAELRAEVETQIRMERFHEQGASQFADWKQRCDDLVKMGADPNFAALLVDMPDGVRVTAALAADPAEVERIAGIRSERGRAVALGKYAALLEDAPTRAAAAERPNNVTRAPAPVRPVTGRAAPQINEYSMTGQQLVDLYMQRNLERQMRR